MANMRVATSLMILAVAVAVLAVPRRTEAAISCGTVISELNPCLPYATGKGPLGGCCAAIKKLYGQAKTTPDRQSVCTCLKSLAGRVDPRKAAALPGQCGVNVPYPISASTDCSKVK